MYMATAFQYLFTIYIKFSYYFIISRVHNVKFYRQCHYIIILLSWLEGEFIVYFNLHLTLLCYFEIIFKSLFLERRLHNYTCWELYYIHDFILLLFLKIVTLKLSCYLNSLCLTILFEKKILIISTRVYAL